MGSEMCIRDSSQLVLCGTGEGEIGRDCPRLGVGVELAAEFLGVLANSTPSVLLEVFEPFEAFTGDALRVVDETSGVRSGDGDGTEFGELLDGVEGDVARTGDEGSFAVDVMPRMGEHVVHEVDGAVPGGFGPDQTAAKGESLAGDGAGEAVLESLVLAEEIADLSAPDADVSSRDVNVLTDVAVDCLLYTSPSPRDS